MTKDTMIDGYKMMKDIVAKAAAKSVESVEEQDINFAITQFEEALAGLEYRNTVSVVMMTIDGSDSYHGHSIILKYSTWGRELWHLAIESTGEEQIPLLEASKAIRFFALGYFEPLYHKISLDITELSETSKGQKTL